MALLDVAAIVARRRLTGESGIERAQLARDAYSYLHLPTVAGIVLIAFGLETTLHDVDETLDTVPAVALCGNLPSLASLAVVGAVCALVLA